jgi:alpha/beta superfamily hydrolase
MTKNPIIKNSLGETLDCSFNTGAADSKKADWLIVLGHGVTGNKDRPVLVDSAKALNAVGFDTLRFSFAGNGNSQGDFRQATISKGVHDLQVVLDAVANSYPNIGYIGHSMGGAVGVIQATKDTRIKALVSLAGMINTKAFAETEFGQETPDAGLMWQEQSCPLSSTFMRDLCETIGTLEPLADCVSTPWLLLHGTADVVVLPRDTERVKSLQGDAVTAVFIEGADHSFNEPDHKAQMTNTVVEWLSSRAV